MTNRRSFSTLLLRYCQLYILILFLVPTSTVGAYPLPRSNGYILHGKGKRERQRERAHPPTHPHGRANRRKRAAGGGSKKPASYFYNPPTHGYRFLLNKIANQAKDSQLVRLMHECIKNPKCRQTLHQL